MLIVVKWQRRSYVASIKNWAREDEVSSVKFDWVQLPVCDINSLADPRGHYGRVSSSKSNIFFNFIQFLGKNGQNRRLGPVLFGFGDPSGKSWIRHQEQVRWSIDQPFFNSARRRKEDYFLLIRKELLQSYWNVNNDITWRYPSMKHCAHRYSCLTGGASLHCLTISSHPASLLV